MQIEKTHVLPYRIDQLVSSYLQDGYFQVVDTTVIYDRFIKMMHSRNGNELIIKVVAGTVSVFLNRELIKIIQQI